MFAGVALLAFDGSLLEKCAVKVEESWGDVGVTIARVLRKIKFEYPDSDLLRMMRSLILM